ncbi:MAG: prepilin peptidase [Acetivibrio ethanolgignens]
MEFTALFLCTVALIYGLLIGSFLNVCIWRIPKGESILSLPSHCTTCGNKIRWYDLVPVFSYLFLKGRCRSCKALISILYPLVELLNGICYLLIFLADESLWERGIPSLDSLLLCLLSSALLVISGIDFKTYEIPPQCNAFILLLGLVRTLLDLESFTDHLLGFVCVSGFLYLLYLLSRGQAIGGGDIKLMAAAGLFLGWQESILAFFLGCIFGSVFHLIRMKLKGADHVLALGPYLSLGIFIAVLYGQKLASAYAGLAGL